MSNCRSCGQTRSSRPIIKKGQTVRKAALSTPVAYSPFVHEAYKQDLTKK